MIRVIISLIVFMVAISTAMGQTKKLYFLNNPESIASCQKLANLDVKSGENARIFLHYKNSSRQVMKFVFQSSHPVAGFVGFSNHKIPGVAGSNAALMFFQRETKISNINISHKWLPGETISGIIEFNAVKDVKINCQTGDTINPKTHIGITNVMESSFLVDIENIPVKVRFGGTGAKPNKGDYGIKQHIVVKNQSKSKTTILVYVSPRAGKAVITWGVNEKYHNTPMLPIKSKYQIATFTLNPGQLLRLTTMPAGGFAYPVELEFLPQAI